MSSLASEGHRGAAESEASHGVAKSIRFDEEADLCLVLGKQPYSTRMHIDSHALIRASPIFRAMLCGNFSEARPEFGDWIVNLPEDDPAGFELLMNIVHGHFQKVPEEVTIHFLTAVTVLTNKYCMTRLLRPWAIVWSRCMEDSPPSKCLWTSWELGQHWEFIDSLRRIQEESRPVLEAVSDAEDAEALDENAACNESSSVSACSDVRIIFTMQGDDLKEMSYLGLILDIDSLYATYSTLVKSMCDAINKIYRTYHDRVVKPHVRFPQGEQIYNKETTCALRIILAEFDCWDGETLSAEKTTMSFADFKSKAESLIPTLFDHQIRRFGFQSCQDQRMRVDLAEKLNAIQLPVLVTKAHLRYLDAQARMMGWPGFVPWACDDVVMKVVGIDAAERSD